MQWIFCKISQRRVGETDRSNLGGAQEKHRCHSVQAVTVKPGKILNSVRPTARAQKSTYTEWRKHMKLQVYLKPPSAVVVIHWSTSISYLNSFLRAGTDNTVCFPLGFSPYTVKWEMLPFFCGRSLCRRQHGGQRSGSEVRTLSWTFSEGLNVRIQMSQNVAQCCP